MIPFRTVLAAMTLAATLPAMALANDSQPEQKLQYVLISFDGAHDNTLWQRSRDLAKQTGAHFTYFLSCVYLLGPETRSEYKPPHHSNGRSNVGFAPSREDIATRLDHIWTARKEGHEIASHGCGHFDGKDWSKADWLSEFDSFSQILREAYTINGLSGEPAGWRDFVQSEIIGFRAPYLSVSKSLTTALIERNFTHDASTVSNGPVAPKQSNGLTSYALPMIPEGPKARPIIAMDYNLFVRHSGGIERKADREAFSNRAFNAFKKAYDREVAGQRHPLQIGFHFVLMNDGAYWDALERFAKEVCIRPDTRCVSYQNLQDLKSADG